MVNYPGLLIINCEDAVWTYFDTPSAPNTFVSIKVQCNNIPQILESCHINSFLLSSLRRNVLSTIVQFPTLHTLLAEGPRFLLLVSLLTETYT